MDEVFFCEEKLAEYPMIVYSLYKNICSYFVEEVSFS